VSTGDVRERLVDVETADGLILPGAMFEPGGERDACVLWIHGFGSGYDYRPCVELGRLLSAAGVGFLAGATRGHYGGATLWRRRGEGWGTRKAGTWFEDLREAGLDIDAWLVFARDAGYHSVILAGHSFGNVKIAWHLGTADGPLPIDGLILGSPSRGIVHLDPVVVGLAHEYLARDRGESLLPEGSWPRGFGTTTVSATTMASWAEVSALVFERAAEWQGRVEAPVLAYYGDAADVGAEPELADFTGGMSRAASIETRILTGVRHNYDGGAPAIAEAITSWWTAVQKAQGTGES